MGIIWCHSPARTFIAVEPTLLTLCMHIGHKQQVLRWRWWPWLVSAVHELLYTSLTSWGYIANRRASKKNQSASSTPAEQAPAPATVFNERNLVLLMHLDWDYLLLDLLEVCMRSRMDYVALHALNLLLKWWRACPTAFTRHITGRGWYHTSKNDDLLSTQAIHNRIRNEEFDAKVDKT